MPKGMFTQGVCVLLQQAVSLDEIAAALSDFEILKRIDASEEWAFSGPSLILAYLPESNGLVSVDLVDRPWPDHMGDANEEFMIFGAWSMGHFGPFAYPGCLERAAQQCWAWEAGETIPGQQQAFIRIRCSYAFGAEDDAPVMPADYEPLPELEFVTKVTAALLELPGALCYFNPNGEVLRDADGVRSSLNYAWSNELPPIDLWSNVRLFNINSQWALMDSVGCGQFDLPDCEAIFHNERYDFTEVDNFLRNVTLYLMDQGEVIKAGDTMDGPGDVRWQAHQRDDGVCDPPRPLLRWVPMDNRELPIEIQQADQRSEEGTDR